MTHFPVYTLDTAPERSRPALSGLAQAFGRVPGVAGVMASSSQLINGLVAVFGQVHGGSFTEAEIQVLLLTNAVTNSAAWAVAFHSFLGLKEGLTEADVEAIRQRQLPQDARLAALSRLARALIEHRGQVDDQAIAAFLEAGFDQALLLEVILVEAASTMTNYTASVARLTLDEFLEPHAWRA
ncbi:carboxymuconolactone decarboxylase family protein [Pseudomonas petrae]|uniref:Alkylhydroperoxidase family enzyme, contains CxxC motif n=1 Tax=Pseudomonas petrae TaxID=2912190 RepID=A0ABS9I834_9PSED|nr:hypothetical protein [Pseudomonas petrae]MCF7533634.1 hypothetical protein [Pseudomonas petrae]MCF7539618.1 hypothetical protein [Pseudomonas petrae]MCF7543927.1 hypothetical protein [Pseudomonas petrae]MCF7558093.1 hypothetical protein [Pseudomonas petrae]